MREEYAHAVVVGAGRSGLAAARLLRQLGGNVRLLERSAARIPAAFAAWAKAEGVDIVCGEHAPEHFVGATVVVPSPGVAASVIRTFLPASNPPEIMAETELAWRQLQGEQVIGVTGTSGKTTTTSLCAAMLQGQGLNVFTGGNIGVPLSEYVLQRDAGGEKVDVAVLELSSFQLQTCSTLRPKVGILLNISENHLDYHADMQEYIDAKMRLFQCQEASDTAVLQAGMEDLAAQYKLQAHLVMYTPSARFENMQLMGAHNRANAEAAWLACRELGVRLEAAERAGAAFNPLEHRLERVCEKQGILYVNDSKATTVEAMRVALESFNRPVLLLAGGKFKGGDLDGLRALVQRKVKAVGLFGASKSYFEKAWQGAVPMTWDNTLEEAMVRLASVGSAGDVMLLAPATSSYDQYENYLRRGDDFKRVACEVLP